MKLEHGEVVFIPVHMRLGRTRMTLESHRMRLGRTRLRLMRDVKRLAGTLLGPKR